MDPNYDGNGFRIQSRGLKAYVRLGSFTYALISSGLLILDRLDALERVSMI